MAVVSPEGKQYYLRVPRPDKNLCCSPKTNTLKVSSPDRYQSLTDPWQAQLSWWHVIETPHMWADVVDCRTVNTFLGDWLVLKRAVTAVWFLCAATENMNGSHAAQLTGQLGRNQTVHIGPKYVWMFDKGVCEGRRLSFSIKWEITSCQKGY